MTIVRENQDRADSRADIFIARARARAIGRFVGGEISR